MIPKMSRKAFLSLFLALVLSLTVLVPGTGVFADEGSPGSVSPFAGGSGTEEDPYLIENAEQLDEVRNYLDSHFLLTGDIDLTAYLSKDGKGYNNGAGWQPIGTEEQPFLGSFYSAGSVIKGLYINRGDEDYVGLFGYLGPGAIVSVWLENVDVTGRNKVGALAGANYGVIIESYATGSVTGNEDVGGLVGHNVESLMDSYTDCTTVGNKSVGGLVGRNSDYVADCYARGTTKGTSCVGGLIGTHEDELYYSYAVGPVSGNSDTGGLVGLFDGYIVFKSYYDKDTTGQSDTGKGEPRSTEELKFRANYERWGFAHIWTITDGETYPILRWQEGAPMGGFGVMIPSGAAQPGVQCILKILYAMDEYGTTRNDSAEVTVYNETDGEVLFQSEAEFRDGEADVPFVLNNTGTYVLRVNVEGVTYSSKILVEVVKPVFAGGSGTAEDPYLIADAIHLDNVRYCLNAHFRLISDIDLNVAPYNEGKGWKPIGGYPYVFSGQFDGNGKTIRGLYINRPGEDDVGLFGIIWGNSVLKNIRLENVNVTGEHYVAGLVGSTNYDTEIANCYVSGIITARTDAGGIAGENLGSIVNSHSSCKVVAERYVGSLAGWHTSGEIRNCSATGDVTGNDVVGGLVGGNDGYIYQSYATGTVTGKTGDSIGGLSGDNFGVIAECYATGNVEGIESVGGLVGYNFGEVLRCYALGSVNGKEMVGGVVGYNESGIVNTTFAAGRVSGIENIGGIVGLNEGGAVKKSYYDSQTTGRSFSENRDGIPKASAEMKKKDTFYAWDFDTVWDIAESQTYPFFRWRNELNAGSK